MFIRFMNDHKTTILFDFDGTLAETMMLIHTIFNRLSGVYGYRHFPEEEIEHCRHLSIHEFIEYYGIPVWKVPLIAIHARRLMHREMDRIHPPQGLVEALTQIHESGRYFMDILTSNRRKNVLKFLAQHKIGWFDEVESTHAILSKKRRVEKYIRQKGLDPANLYYIGDTTVDVESAKHAGARTVAVSWGLNTAEALAKANPDHLIDDPLQLLDIFPAV
ncbi:Pyrophosphatase PpaX [Pontiella desulfatans]|uniref:Pyrophosphatase PpaX n=2 Tax=Pontiella desulfatans TaxID=2750659 RepID=A0A6C2U2M6_PONDE|nr:Pyrophosphatase PpaX [Pontiella desulfatans]